MRKILFLMFVVLTACTKDKVFDDPKTFDDPACFNVETSCQRPETDSIESILDILKTYSPVGANVLETYLSGCFPYNFFGEGEQDKPQIDYITGWFQPKSLSWLEEDYPTVLDTLIAMGTMVHENYHATTNRLYGEEIACGDYYFLPNGEDVRVDWTFSSIDEAFRDQIPSKIYTSRIAFYLEFLPYSIYDALNEFAAYYHDSKVSLDLWPLYKSMYDENGEMYNLRTFASSFESAYEAYYEFKYIQLGYLAYAKNRTPNIHSAILENENYWKVFNYYDTEFPKVIDAYWQIVEENPKLKEILQMYYTGGNVDVLEFQAEFERLDWK